jgi:glutamate-ammonia-ligase adenylyltransferase
MRKPADDRFILPLIWPRPADAGAAARLLERFTNQGAVEARLSRGPGGVMLACIGGNSPYLADLTLREAASIRLLVQRGPDAVVAKAMATLASIPPTWQQARLARALREAKRQVALAVALADIGGIWKLDRVTQALSALAEAALRKSVAHLLRAGHDRGDLVLPDPSDPETGSGFTVLAMGKLGAGELNYSSDVDLVLLHDPDAGIYRGDQCSSWFSRLSRGLVTLMEARDADGYVFRTDLRLRPDPAATPACINLHAAISYYESMGQNWERAAMLKARPIAGDLAMGHAFLEAIRPFIWRRHLDFAAVADISAMKRRIDEHKKTALTQSADRVARVAGHNVKLGQGGIREIEFLTQTLQLVWGGRDPSLRDPRTLPALRLLVRAGHVKQHTAVELAAAYRFLRKVEHRLQMVADRQTHLLPDTPAGLEKFAIFMGYANAQAFAAALLRQLDHVRRHYDAVFSDVPDATVAPPLDFSGTDPPPATVAALHAMGFQHPDRIAHTIFGWQSGRVRAMRSHRARDLLGPILPGLLTALGRQPMPDAAFMRFASLLERLPAGVQLLSMFQRNFDLVGRIADVLGAAPQLADYLARTPSALDGLLGDLDQAPVGSRLRSRLATVTSLEEAIGIIRATVREADFAISVATLEGRMDADEAGLQRALLADASLSTLLPQVMADFADRYGRVRGGSMAVVVLGKAGGRETMAGSDLDLMLIYDHPAASTQSTGGARALPASQWFIRAVHSFVAALTAPDSEGPTYAVDMRLRPSGNKGPVAVSLAAFEAYHEGQAWTWERMALTRARVVAGPPRLRRRVEALIRAAILRADKAKIQADAVSMRARMLREQPKSTGWDVKLRPGGQIEVEFVVQVLQLLHGPVSPTLRLAVEGLRAQGHLDIADADLLIRADRVWRTVQGMLRLTDGARPPLTLSDAASTALLRGVREAGMSAVDLDDVRTSLDKLAENVRHTFTRLVGPIEP